MDLTILINFKKILHLV